MRTTLLVFCTLYAVAAGFSWWGAKPRPQTRLDIAAPPRAAPKPTGAGSDPLTPPRFGLGGPPRTPSEYDLNLGRAIDTLRMDYPKLFDQRPDLSIFAPGVELHDPSGRRLRGVAQYERVFDMLRFLRRTTMQDAEITYRLVMHDDEIRMRWCAKMFVRDPALGLTGKAVIDGVSVYELDAKGKIRAHRLENIVMTDQNQMQSVDLGFLWPTPRMATPELAVPFFRALELASYEAPAPPELPGLPVLRRLSGNRRRSSEPRASAQLSGEETPMQRAAREREEDAAKARRLAELRTPAKPKREEGGFFGIKRPQTCETSYDCDAPLVCCDLIVASVCCGGGMLVGAPPDPIYQPRAIPIPVEKDSPFPPGINPPTGGGSAPQYPPGM